MGMPVKYPYARSKRWEFFTWKDIPSKVHPELVHLRRLRVIGTPLFSIFVHFIFEPDTDRDPHDHPWPFFSIVLRGLYEEVVYKRIKHLSFHSVVHQHRRFSCHRFSLDWAHQIVMVKPGTVTLVFAGHRLGHKVSEWGFYTSDGFVFHTEYDKFNGNVREA